MPSRTDSGAAFNIDARAEEAAAAAHQRADEGDTRTLPPEDHNTDTGNAGRFARMHAGAVRYCYQWKSWLYFDGRRWIKDESGEIEKRAKETVREMYAEANGRADDASRKLLVKWALKSESASGIAAMTRLAQSEPGIPVMVDEFDRDQWLFNVANGTIELKTGTLREHRPEDLLTKLAPAPYDAEATCPTFEAFLNVVMAGNANLIGFLQRAVGYSLSASIREQVIFIPHGFGKNGKSTFIEAIEKTMGDYALSTPPETLMVRFGDGPTEDVARLCGARFVSAVESEDGRRLAESRIKQLTGGDKVSARFLYGHFFDFRPTFKIWYATNHLPTVRGQDEAIWRRIMKIPFNVTIPEKEREQDYFTKRLAPELPGILAWAVAGCLRWQAEGLNGPDEVRQATDEYRHEQDIVAAFIADRCLLDEHRREAPGRLYKAFADWCHEQGDKHVMTNTAFGRRLTEKGIRPEREAGGKRWRVGVSLFQEYGPVTG